MHIRITKPISKDKSEVLSVFSNTSETKGKFQFTTGNPEPILEYLKESIQEADLYADLEDINPDENLILEVTQTALIPIQGRDYRDLCWVNAHNGLGKVILDYFKEKGITDPKTISTCLHEQANEMFYTNQEED